MGKFLKRFLESVGNFVKFVEICRICGICRNLNVSFRKLKIVAVIVTKSGLTFYVFGKVFLNG